MRKKFIAVIANDNAGKSTIIQSLTGCRSKQHRGVVIEANSGKEIWVCAASPQEKRISDAELNSLFQNAATRKKSTGAVVAIRPSHSHRKRPGKFQRQSMEKVFALARQHRLVPFAFVITPPYKGHISVAVDPAQVHSRLKKKVLFQTLDGRRFSHVNASIIRNTAGLF